MDDNSKLTLGVIAYSDVDTAKNAMKDVKQMEKEGVIKVEDLVVVSKNEKGKAKIIQAKELTSRKGAMRLGGVGLVAGAVLGGPVAWALLGATAGGILGKVTDKGFDNKVMKQFSNEIESGKSVLFVLLKDFDFSKVDNRLSTKYGGKMEAFVLSGEKFAAVGAISEDEAFIATISEVADVEEDE